MASMAFMFAMAIVKKPKLMLMDEIDAFLDADNAQRVA